MRSFFIILILLFPLQSFAQTIKDFFYLDVIEDRLPVFIRGNLNSNKVILFVQGGPGETALDFARADYPRWKNTLEKEVAIAYYDQRGLNQKVKNIDTTKITYTQYSLDIIALAKALELKYDTNIYLMGHSAGGNMVLNTLQLYPKESSFIKGAIVLNTPITTDYSLERWNKFRPLYLRNLAKEKAHTDIDSIYWREAYNWISATDSINSLDQVRKWNSYVDNAFKPVKRKTSLGMLLRVIFSRPFNPIKYLRRSDNDLVDELLWKSEKALTTFVNLYKINLPVLLLTGRYDNIGLPEENIEAHNLIEFSTLSIIPDAGHESFLDQPELFNQSILSFIHQN